MNIKDTVAAMNFLTGRIKKSRKHFESAISKWESVNLTNSSIRILLVPTTTTDGDIVFGRFD